VLPRAKGHDPVCRALARHDIPDISGNAVPQMPHVREGFSFHEGFAAYSMQILHDHGPLAAALSRAVEPGCTLPHRKGNF
jgi:hypothetical protein